MTNRNRLVFRRRGFTLVEMLLALAILTVIATLSIAVIPKIKERTKATAGADNVQQWLLIAKQWALRDRLPTGIRLNVDPTYGDVRTLQYIQQQDSIAGTAALFDGSTLTAPPQRIFIQGMDLGGTGSLQAIWPVQAGDYIQLYGGPSYKILMPETVTFNNNVPTTSLLLANQEFSAQTLPPGVPPPPAPAPQLYSITNFVITRQPRPVAGEPLLKLPDDVVIDPTLSVPNITTVLASGTNYDILFTPSGPLTGPLGNSNGKIVLWVRDVAQDPPFPLNPQNQPGDQILIVVFGRTGRIGAFPYNPDPNNPYLYVFDPRNSGL
jgi:prepilin-type N-terminal cleavage/methylation domain-containing protein